MSAILAKVDTLSICEIRRRRRKRRKRKKKRKKIGDFLSLRA
jgi:hypothetical protein